VILQTVKFLKVKYAKFIIQLVLIVIRRIYSCSWWAVEQSKRQSWPGHFGKWSVVFWLMFWWQAISTRILKH